MIDAMPVGASGSWLLPCLASSAGASAQRHRIAHRHPVLVLVPLAWYAASQHAVSPTERQPFERTALHHIIQGDIPFPFLLIAARGHADVRALEVCHRRHQP